MPPSDSELLRDYALHQSEAAFTELVHRHLDLVYTVAKRTLGSESLAADVAQSVFLDLAQRARLFRHGSTLIAWLHVVTRRTAIDLIRRESRRQLRERENETTAIMGSSPDSWTQLVALLDEALSHLDDVDRTAVLLRFFENKSLREVGAALGISDDAAQKRLTRAMDRLRLIFVRRGITVTAAGLAAGLPLHAIETAPATLGVSISAAVATKATIALAVAHATQTLAMTATQKILVATTFVALLGGLFEAHVIHLRNLELDEFRQRTAQLERDLDFARIAHANEVRQSAADCEELASLRTRVAAFGNGDPAAEDALAAWLERVRRLKEKLRQMPDKQIPEMQYLTDEDWLAVTHHFTKLDTDFEIREALASVRNMAENHVAKPLSSALTAFVETHGGRLPDDPAQLKPYLDSQTDPTILQRYEMLHTGSAESFNRGGWIMRAKPVDDFQDTLLEIGLHGGYGLIGGSRGADLIRQAVDAFRAAHDGQSPVTADQLSGYLPRPVESAIVDKFLHDAPSK